MFMYHSSLLYIFFLDSSSSSALRSLSYTHPTMQGVRNIYKYIHSACIYINANRFYGGIKKKGREKQSGVAARQKKRAPRLTAATATL